ncbi:diguanylate cyclase [Fervidobacterium thailandense]|uniref:Diguanylate cyclase n=1 Tax=Fervidobacterium thailandense TaxID=1008305 RepID=A0A1E3G3T7_9BACT|nr:diguanylate cyclase [Fervidobacterium thailandense]
MVLPVILTAFVVVISLIVVWYRRHLKKMGEELRSLEHFLSVLGAVIDKTEIGLAVWKSGELVYINSKIIEHADSIGLNLRDREQMEYLIRHPEEKLPLFDILSFVREYRVKQEEVERTWRKELGKRYVEIKYVRKKLNDDFYGIVITRDFSFEFTSVEHNILTALVDVLVTELSKEEVDLYELGEQVRTLLTEYGLVDIFGIALLEPGGTIYYPYFKYSDEDDRSGMRVSPDVKNVTRFVIDKSVKIWIRNSEKEQEFPDGYRLQRIRGEVFTIYAVPIVYRHLTRGAVLFEKQGEDQFSELTVALFDKVAGMITLALSFVETYNEVRAERQKLFEMSIRDYLTEAYTRMFLEQFLEKELSKSKRTGSPISIVFLDVDKFKEINDRFGHVYGDRVLQTLVRVAKKNIRAMDLITRYGGDEFVIVLPNTDPTHAGSVMYRIVEALKEYGISISYGIIDASKFDSIDEIYREVDAKMYEMKKARVVNRKLND